MAALIIDSISRASIGIPYFSHQAFDQRPGIASGGVGTSTDTLAHDRPKCERFGGRIMRNYNASNRDLGKTKTFSRRNRGPILPMSLWMSRAVVLYSRSDHCKAAGSCRTITTG